jgi:two-component system sensor histidine kinase MtrB
MAEGWGSPGRFRRRLRLAFILVVAVSTGAFAVLTYAGTSGYRSRKFEATSLDEAEVALKLAPRTLNEDTFERMLRIYENRAGADIVARSHDKSFTSSVHISIRDIPSRVLDTTDDHLVVDHLRLDGVRYLLVGGRGPAGSDYAFLFSLAQMEAGLAELKVVFLAGWALVSLAAGAAGELVARRTLRPVRDAATAATAIAEGQLETRLSVVGDDEFSAWARSFNQMADALEAKLEALAVAAERERRFTADVAHDLRTPLTGISVTASLLDDRLDELTPETRQAVQILVRDVLRLKELVLDLLELSRLDSGGDVVEPEDLRVADGLDAALGPRAAQAEVYLEPDLTVRAERVAFRRIVTNLVDNALAHGGGGVVITGRASGSEVLLEVIDDGPGIDPADVGKVFDRFYKSDESRGRGGSGLGLAIAREHARAQGGDVELGEAASGACFVVRLPAGSPRCGDAPHVELAERGRPAPT